MTESKGDPHHTETLSRDLARYSTVELAIRAVSRPLVAPGLAMVFAGLAGLAALLIFGQSGNAIGVVLAASLGSYMALNIGAKDAANTVGPAVGAKALPLGWAITIAMGCIGAGALLAGGDVVATIASGIVPPEAVGSSSVSVWMMVSALLAAALWVNLATTLGTPVSTTHAIVGGVIGAGLAAGGPAAVSWPVVGMITASWVISPVLGGILAAAVLWLIKSQVIYRNDKIAAARIWVPRLVGLMVGTFAAYLTLYGLSAQLRLALAVGAAAGALAWAIMIPVIAAQSQGLENRNK